MNQQSRKTFFIVLVFIVLVVGVSGFFVQTIFFGAPESDTEVKRYVIPLNSDQNVLIETLETEGFVKNRQALRIALYLKGKSLNEARKLEKEQVYDMLSIPISPQRVKCALLSWETLRRLIKIMCLLVLAEYSLRKMHMRR